MVAKPLKESLEEYIQGTDLTEINNTISIQTTWEKTVGKPISKNTKIDSFKNGIIKIKTSNPVWRNELSFQKQHLLEKLKKIEPDLNIKKIIII